MINPYRLAATLALLCSFGQAQSGKLTLSSTRHSPTDLEVTGLVRNAPGFLSRAQLLSLPQTTATLTGDPDLVTDPHLRLHIHGVALETLSAALGLAPEADLIDALCTDRYRAHYPAAYLTLHHPILALTIDGLSPAAWAARTRQDDPGPYFITHHHFTPAFHLLTHADQPQQPTNILRLNFSHAATTFAAITPPGPPSEQVTQGLRIAQQNCLRCHSYGTTGGTKSGRDWISLSTWAREQPRFFAAYIHNPQAIEPHAHMPASPGYDAATLAALTAYFQTFTKR